MSTTIDLRGYGTRKKHSAFSLADIYYSVEQTKDQQVPKMIVIEKQPKLPYYWSSAGNYLYKAGSEILTQLLGKAANGADASGFYKKLGAEGAEAALEQGQETLGTFFVNTMVSKYSTSGKADAYWKSDKEYLNHLENLFTVETGSESGMKTYEFPFFSDYFMEADGISGWKSEGMSTLLGRSIANNSLIKASNINYPVTPSWEYQDKGQTIDFSFNLINDTSTHMKQNLTFLLTIFPGMMMTIINYFGDKSVNEISGSVGEAASYFTSMYKSPNVYEIVVPGRFRWLWSTMSMKASCIGKYCTDSSIKDLADAYGVSDAKIGIPEAIKLDITIQSLLPTTVNEYYYFLSSKNSNSRRTESGTAAKVADNVGGFISGTKSLGDIIGMY